MNSKSGLLSKKRRKQPMTYDDAGPVQCKLCNAMTPDLREHLKTCSAVIRPKSHTCCLCDARPTFTTDADYDAHLKVCAGNRAFTIADSDALVEQAKKLAAGLAAAGYDREAAAFTTFILDYTGVRAVAQTGRAQ